MQGKHLSSELSLQLLFSYSSTLCFSSFSGWNYLLVCSITPLIAITIFIHFTAAQSQKDLESTSQKSKGPLRWLEVSVSFCFRSSSPTILNNKSGISQCKCSSPAHRFQCSTEKIHCSLLASFLDVIMLGECLSLAWIWLSCYKTLLLRWLSSPLSVSPGCSN